MSQKQQERYYVNGNIFQLKPTAVVLATNLLARVICYTASETETLTERLNKIP